jgi:hypothetical protein
MGKTKNQKPCDHNEQGKYPPMKKKRKKPKGKKKGK